MIFEPLDFIARLAALVPPPRLNLTRFHGVFAPNSPHRGERAQDYSFALLVAGLAEEEVAGD